VRSKSAIYWILALAALLTAVLMLLKPWDRTSLIDRKVKLRDGTRIDSIVLSGTYDTVSLVRNKGKWLMGEEDVNQVAVENLLYAAGHLQVVSVYDDPLQPDKEDPVRVSFFHAGRSILTYRVTGGGKRFLLLPEGDKRAFRVELPGYAGNNLRDVFSVRPNHFRKHLLIDLLPSEVREVEVARKGEDPFRFTMDDSGHFTCTFPGLDSVADPQGLDELSLRLLFSYFTNIRFEQKLDEKSAADPGRFMATLRVESRTGEKHTLDIYSMPADKGPGDHIYKAVVMHNDDPFPLVIKYIYLDVLMRPLRAYYVDNG